MAQFSPVGDFNIGQNATLTFTGNGNTYDAGDLGLFTKFSAKSDDRLIEVDAISNRGIPVFKGIPRGWKGRIEWARDSGDLADWYLAQALDFFNGVGVQTLWTRTLTVQNDDRTANSYIFTGTTFYNFDQGDFVANKEVPQSVEFMAQQCVPNS